MSGQQSVQQEGDRFTLPKEILFASGSSQLSPAGQRSKTIERRTNDLALDIPETVDWILRSMAIRTVGSALANRSFNATRYGQYSTHQSRLPARKNRRDRLWRTPTAGRSDTEAAYRLNRRIELSLSSR